MRPRLGIVRSGLVLVLVSAFGVPETRPVAAASPPGFWRLAQAPALSPTRPITIRGTVIALDGPHLRVATASGDQVVRLVEPLTVTGARSAGLSDITAGTFVGTAARTETDGTLQALEVHISQRSPCGAPARAIGRGSAPGRQ